ncbi:hypothetical protein MLD38_034217 [Melastoma candidum]|uniref:Uncharacterized protein n=1 Tax=Melastoma candidum TaxID=119954 RepID=A0ACB9M987_9MYRT|nr:hypothetical protein MLD38_034217 [Melastoma candidum]
MPDFDLPSFSLGLDSDPEGDPGLPPPCCVPEDVADQLAEDSGLEDEPTNEDAQPLFRRLRRGVLSHSVGARAAIAISSSPETGGGDADDDDDIEEFSSPEDSREDAKSSAHLRSASGGEKVPLCGRHTGSVSSSSRSTVTKEENPSTISGRRLVNRKSFVSPLRRFHLVDSDSDNSPTRSESPIVANGIFDMPREAARGANEHKASSSQLRRKGESSGTHGTEDLWKTFSPVEGFRISTPALDKVCEEYYQNKSQKFHVPASFGDDEWPNHTTTTQINESRPEGNFELPPAHHYFFHEDPNIRNLVRRRLPHFSPIGGVYSQENKQSTGSLIDYVHQFAHGESSRVASTAEQKTNLKKRSRARSRATHSKAKESQYSLGWVDLKTSGDIPMNAGKKRVQVTSKSTGHWYTAPGGRKVYVTGNGQELTGESAYRCYKKEKGTALKKPKRKGNPKKKGKV